MLKMSDLTQLLENMLDFEIPIDGFQCFDFARADNAGGRLRPITGGKKAYDLYGGE